MPPIAPEKVFVPVPDDTVNARAVASLLLTVLLNATLLFVVVKVRSPPLSVTAPVYVCAPLVVILPPKAMTPVTFSDAKIAALDTLASL